MTASRTPIPMRGVNVVLLRDGSEIHIDDIETAAHGQEILDEIDAAILQIEDQFDNDHPSQTEEWRVRARTALKKKRRIRPALQQRIGELRRAEKRAAAPTPSDTVSSQKDGRRKAFVAAAEQLLDRKVFTEIWARAAELKPALFEAGEGASP